MQMEVKDLLAGFFPTIHQQFIAFWLVFLIQVCFCFQDDLMQGCVFLICKAKVVFHVSFADDESVAFAGWFVVCYSKKVFI